MGIVIWSKNCIIDDDLVENVKDQIKNDTTTYDPLLKYHTTYFSDKESRPELLFLDYYSNIIQNVTEDLSLFHRSNYIFPFWAQLYTNRSKKFSEHDHFSGNEILSWIHFLTQSSNKCLYFVDSRGNKIYPDQNKGDFIVFPSWVMHGVDSPSDNERFVIAGNVNLKTIRSSVDNSTFSECSHYEVVDKNICLWEKNIFQIPVKNKKGFKHSK